MFFVAIRGNEVLLENVKYYITRKVRLLVGKSIFGVFTIGQSDAFLLDYLTDLNLI